jgi:hypothetical protein
MCDDGVTSLLAATQISKGCFSINRGGRALTLAKAGTQRLFAKAKTFSLFIMISICSRNDSRTSLVLRLQLVCLCRLRLDYRSWRLKKRICLGLSFSGNL